MGKSTLRKISIVAVFAAVVIGPLTGGAALCETGLADTGGSRPAEPERPRVGLVLSGGGARGVAHIGVLRVLEQNRVPVDYIAGTSMGALVGGLYAAGHSLDELEQLVGSIDWSEVLVDHIPRQDRSFRRKRDDDLYLMRQKPGVEKFSLRFPPGILDGQKVDLMLKRETIEVSGIKDFDDLAIPFRAVGADIVTGEAVVLGEGDLALALRASMALPGIFAPRMIDGRLLVDGGISCNLPIDIVRSMGADIVIAVDISTPLAKLEELGSILAITGQLTGFLTRRNADLQIGTLGPDDIFILPELGDITTGSFERSMEAVPIGVQAAESVIDRLEKLSLDEAGYAAHIGSRSIEKGRPIIDRITIYNDSRIADGVIESMLTIETGGQLDIDLLEKQLIAVYGLELFESVYYDVEEVEGENVLSITARERSWGPNYIQAGFAVSDDFEAANFNVCLAYSRTAINRLGGEWRTGFQMGQEPGVFSEFYQPVDRGMRYFFKLKSSYIEQTDNLIDPEGAKFGELGIYRYGGILEAGRELGTWGRISAGLKRESGKITVQVGDPDAPEHKFDNGEVFAQFHIDELDDVHFPGSGSALLVRGTAGLEQLGSGMEYRQGIVDGRAAVSAGSWSFAAGGYFASTLDSDAPYQNMFPLGGLMRLSGLEQDERRGQHAALVTAMVYRRMPVSSMLSLNLGLTAEYGNVFQSREEIGIDKGLLSGSLFLGADTIVGPIFIALGLAEHERSNFYFCLGLPYITSRSMRLDH